MAHVFISYKSEDHEFAFELNQQVKDAGFTTWIDKEWLRAGEDWREEIDDAIRDSFVLILIITPAAAKSKYVVYEFAFAWALGIKVIPVMLENVELKDFHPRLEGRQYEDFQRDRPWGKLFRRLQEVEGPVNSNQTPHSVQRAVSALDSHDPKERATAIDSLAQINHPAAHEALVVATEHMTKDVRIGAALKLSRIDDFSDVRVLPAFVEVFENASVHGRVNILKTIGKNKYSEALSLVLKALRDSVPAVQYAAAETLGEIRDASAVPELIMLLVDRSRTGFLRSSYESIGNIAVQSLERIGTPEALAAVEQWRREQDGQQA